jgi:hypothetical protein
LYSQLEVDMVVVADLIWHLFHWQWLSQLEQYAA